MATPHSPIPIGPIQDRARWVGKSRSTTTIAATMLTAVWKMVRWVAMRTLMCQTTL
jgi:hypothetical protein